MFDAKISIVDAHHHLWFMPNAYLDALNDHSSTAGRKLAPVFRSRQRYLFDEFVADLLSAPDIVATVYVEGGTMYNPRLPPELQSVGEVEFANGIAAMAASGQFGPVRINAGIVGSADLRLGERVVDILEAHIHAGNGRYRGIRPHGVAFDEDEEILGPGAGTAHLLSDSKFRLGFSRLAGLNLSFEVWLLEPQIPDLILLARDFPDTQIILDHMGAPTAIGRYSGQREERFPTWRHNIQELSRYPNVNIKLSGIGLPFADFLSYRARPPLPITQIAAEWAPYIETCIEAFGVDRCMFGSNFPVDCSVSEYASLWNVYKYITRGASTSEREALFGGTAARVYKLSI